MANIITRIFDHLGSGGWSTESVDVGGGGEGGVPDPLTVSLNVEPTSDAEPAVQIVSPGSADDYSDVLVTKNSSGDPLLTVDSAGEVSVHVRESGADGLAIIDHASTSGKLFVVSSTSDIFRIDGDHQIGFFGHVPVSRPNIVASGEETVGEVIDALVALGLVTHV